jgi:transposase
MSAMMSTHPAPAAQRRERKISARHGDSPVRSQLREPPESATLWLVFGTTARPQMDTDDRLPDDIDALRALIAAERAVHAAVVEERDQLTTRNTALEGANARLDAANARLQQILAEIRRAHFGRKSERIDDDQLALALEELETAHAKIDAETEQADPVLKAARTKQRRTSRNENLEHLPHEEVVIEPDSTSCPCCGGELHQIGEDKSKRLDRVPALLRVIVTRRPKYACRTCEKTGSDGADVDGHPKRQRETAGIVQAPAPARLIAGGLPTEAMVADVVVSKHADHLPLYRQSQILARQGVAIERSTLAQWVGAAAAELQPLHDHLVKDLLASPKLFCDETRCPVLDPGRGKTKTGYLWALARDDRAWGGSADACGHPERQPTSAEASGPPERRQASPPAVAYTYAPGRGGEHAVKLLAGFSGILQVDGYSVYQQLAAPSRACGPVTLAFCWAHVRRKFYEIYARGNAPIATEALARIKTLYDVEADIRGLPPQIRRALRQEHAKPVVEALKPWLEASLAQLSKGSKLAQAIRYGLNHWDGLVRYLEDGRIEIDSNTVERSIRGIALSRKNALFAGHDKGAEGWAMIASLLETCKLNAVDPLAWLTDVLTKLVNLWPASRIGELMPWAYAVRPA